MYISTLEICNWHLKVIVKEEMPWHLLENKREAYQFLHSKEWNDFYDSVLVQKLRLYEEDEFMMVPPLIKRFAKGLRACLTATKNETQNRQKMLLEQEANETVIIKVFREEEVNRLASMAGEWRREHNRIGRQWLIKEQELTRERANFHGKLCKTRWKQDRTENHSRMRLRMVINYDFDDHIEASAKRDKSSRGEPVEIPKQKKSYNTMCPKQALLESEVTDKEEEEWNVINGDETEKYRFSTECELIFLLSLIKGRIELNGNALIFRVDRSAITKEFEEGFRVVDSELLRDRKWQLKEVKEIHFRRYMLRNSALEFFMSDGTSYFINFPSIKERMKLYERILASKPENLANPGIRSPVEILKKSNLTQQWQRHEISNFDYLMQLNSIAGRTYNDLTQYFVFPWILKDYEAEEIDINDEEIYRDLSKPVGALDAARLERFVERYNTFEDPSGKIKKFHYGTHYSSAATVAFYLLRVEPFTSIHLVLQGGKFDHADRQYHSLLDCWKSCLKGSGDVKELIPEFFYLPEMFVNANGFDLGKSYVHTYLGVKQTGIPLGDVNLPPWAKTPEEFVKIHAEALESEYVSQNLHQWIDLIFGYKQTGEEAVKAHNVFYYLTYEGAVDIDAIQDPIERTSVQEQIFHFGQTPTQLLRKPHPRRYSRPAPEPPILHGNSFMAIETDLTQIVFVAVSIDHNRLVAVDTQGHLAILVRHGCWEVSQYHRIQSPFSYDAHIGASSFCSSIDTLTLISSGHWDGYFRFIQTTTGSVQSYHGKPDDLVTCLAVSEDGSILVTGSRYGTVYSWSLRIDDSKIQVLAQQAFYGHDDEVVSVAVNVEYDVVVSGARDGACLIHSLRNGEYIRTINTANQATKIAVTSDGRIIITTSVGVLLYTLNGRKLHEMCMAVYDCVMINHKLICAVSGAIKVLDGNYCTISENPLSLCAANGELFVGCQNGSLIVYQL